MMLRQLRIEHFRGIRSANWKIDQRLVALVGAGDSTKTTLLDAIGLVLSPSYNPQFSDGDFYDFDLSKNIVIEAVVTELPDNLVKEGQLGKDRSGLMPDGTLIHDPVDDAAECLVVRLTVTPDLDPTWEVVRPDSDDARPISASQRRQLGFFRLGERPDLHLRWARGSALSSLTEGDDGAASVILDAHREARAAAFETKSNALHQAASVVQERASTFGAAAFGKLRPGLEPGSLSSTHALMLHDGEVPLSRLGLGTRRLTSLAIQERSMVGGSIIAIDEIEHGLEPHRLTQALHRLRQRTEDDKVQIIMTTHSPVAVTTLRAKDIQVVHADGAGNTSCRSVPSDLDNVQGTLRSAPEALLGRRVLVAEGATEVGVLRELLRYWDKLRFKGVQDRSAAMGIVIVNGRGGAQAVQRATNFQRLGYPTCLLLDNDDRSVDPVVEKAKGAGVAVHRWAMTHDIEHEVISSLPLAGVQEVVDLAVEVRGEEAVLEAVAAKLGSGAKLDGISVTDWLQQATSNEDALRSAIADAAVASRKEWFKREDRGEELAGVVTAHLSELAKTHLMTVLNRIRAFVYADESVPTPSDGAEETTRD